MFIKLTDNGGDSHTWVNADKIVYLYEDYLKKTKVVCGTLLAGKDFIVVEETPEQIIQMIEESK